MIEQTLKQSFDLHIILQSNKVYIGIGIGIGNFVADISVIAISVKTHIGAPLNNSNYACNNSNHSCSDGNHACSKIAVTHNRFFILNI